MSSNPAGWYADPSNAPQQRFWDGSTWTDQVQPFPDPTRADLTNQKKRATGSLDALPWLQGRMTNQRKVFQVTALCGLVGAVLPAILMLAFGHATGAAVTVLTVVSGALMLVAAVAIPIALATYKEQGRKPGSLPLIYAVIAFPLGLILMFIYFAAQFPPLMLIALIGIFTSVPALIIGLVKKLSVKAAPTVAPSASVLE